jgi:hypothetical protein
MRSVGRRAICVRRGRERRADACESQHGRAAKGIFRRLPWATSGPIFIDGQGILAYAADAVAILLAAMNANVSAGPRVPPEPG